MVFIFLIAIGALAAFIAQKFNKNPLLWFSIAFISGGWGILALILVIVADFFKRFQ